MATALRRCFSQEVTIPAGESLSESLPLHGTLGGMIFPAELESETITFQVAVDDDPAAFVELYDAEGDAYTLEASKGKALGLDDGSLLSAFPFFRLRFGTADNPVVQAAEVTLYITIK